MFSRVSLEVYRPVINSAEPTFFERVSTLAELIFSATGSNVVTGPGGNETVRTRRRQSHMVTDEDDRHHYIHLFRGVPPVKHNGSKFYKARQRLEFGSQGRKLLPAAEMTAGQSGSNPLEMSFEIIEMEHEHPPNMSITATFDRVSELRHPQMFGGSLVLALAPSLTDQAYELLRKQSQVASDTLQSVYAAVHDAEGLPSDRIPLVRVTRDSTLPDDFFDWQVDEFKERVTGLLPINLTLGSFAINTTL